MATQGGRSRGLGRNGTIAAAVIGGIFTLLATVLTIVFGRDSDPPPSPRPGAASTTPPDEVRRLLGLLPADSVSSCTPIQPPVGAQAKVQCAATPQAGQPPIALTFTLYGGLATSRQAFNELVPAVVRETANVCPNGPDRSDYTLPNQKRPAGLLACWVADNKAPYVVWSRDDPGVLAIAAGPVGGTLQQVWNAWLNTRIAAADDDENTTSGSPTSAGSPS